jgi:hypothetical protein
MRRMIAEDNDDFYPIAFGPHIEEMRRFDPWEREWWYAAVHEYSGRQLTHKTDKLTALAGIAMAIHTYSQQWYLAGLWLLELPLGLMWQPSQAHRERNSSTWCLLWEQALPDPLLPYWSWAAFDGQVDYNLLHGFDHGCVDITHVSVDGAADVHMGGFDRVDGAHIRLTSRFVAEAKLSEKDHIPGFTGPTKGIKYYSMFAQLRFKYFVSRARFTKNLSGIVWYDTNPLDLPETTFLFFSLCRTCSHFSEIKSRSDEFFDLGIVLMRVYPSRVRDLTFHSLGLP